MARPVNIPSHPAQLRPSILATALLAMLTWWGVGLPYSLYTWLLDPEQLRWVLVCYAWEVPLATVLGPVLFTLRWFRDIERRWDTVFGDPARAVDAAAATALERIILDLPLRVARVILVASLVGYGVGAFLVHRFAELPVDETIKIVVLGVATGLIGALFAFLYLESRLAPLLERFALVAPYVPPAGRRVPLHQKVFACSIIMTLTPLILLGTALYSRAERVLEDELGRRLLGETRQLAAELATARALPDPAGDWWRQRAAAMRLGDAGYILLVDGGGRVIGGSAPAAALAEQGFRPALAASVLTEPSGRRIDRVHTQRVVGFAALGDSGARAVAVAYRRDFEAELSTMLSRGLLIFGATFLLALVQGFLFARRLARPIEALTERAGAISRRPGGPWETVPVRTNDEVGELATAFNQMIARLADAVSALERRVAEATHRLAALYDVTRTTTSTLELNAVLALVAEKTLALLGLGRLVVLWHPATADDAIDAYAARAGSPGGRIDFDTAVDLGGLCQSLKPRTVSAAALPAPLAAWLEAPQALALPLVFQGELLGVILGTLERDAAAPDDELAAALGRQAAAALANARLFDTIRQKEVELRRLSHMRAQLQEETLRSLSRELHDGIGQVLTVVGMELGMLERSSEVDPPALRAGLRNVRDQVVHLMHEVRSMCQLLRPPTLDFGVVPTIRSLAEKVAASSGITVDVRTPPEETRFPPEIELVLYRLVQEALTNVARHAHARRARVALEAQDGRVVLVVADDGVGFDADRLLRSPALAGVGLLGIRERVAHYHGTLDIRARPQAGTRITVVLPLGGSGADDAAAPARTARSRR